MTQEDVIKITNVMVMWYETEFEIDNLALRIHDNEYDWSFKTLSRNKIVLHRGKPLFNSFQ
jgi:hypothetical protein